MSVVKKPNQGKKPPLLLRSQKKLASGIAALYFEVHPYYLIPALLIYLWTSLLRATFKYQGIPETYWGITFLSLTCIILWKWWLYYLWFHLSNCIPGASFVRCYVVGINPELDYKGTDVLPMCSFQTEAWYGLVTILFLVGDCHSSWTHSVYR